MHAIYDLKEQLCKELEEYGQKGELTAGTLDVVDKLAHAVKNIDKIIEKYEEDEGYSGRYEEGMSNGGGMYRGTYNGSYNDGRHGGSYARGRNAKRDSMGRYSRRSSYDDGMIQELRDLMQDAPDERTRKEFQTFISKMEQQM